MSIKYSPSIAPGGAEDVPPFLNRELIKLSNVVNSISEGHMDVTNVVPAKPRAGDIRYADGTNWNPGSGEGLYLYLSTGAWSSL